MNDATASNNSELSQPSEVDFSILIVEDDEDARRSLEDVLSIDGYKIHSVSHCLPAIELFEQTSFDAAIIDWRLPDGDGGSLIPIFSQKFPGVPVIVVTGMREFETVVGALRQGAYDFLTKPINPEMLRSLFSRLVERKRHLSELEETQNRLVESERLAAIGQMVAGLAHETRNAFQRSHACLAELSLDLQGMPDSLKLVQKTQKALDDINHLLEEVRHYSAPIVLEIRRVDPRELVQRVWQEVAEVHGSQQSPDFQIRCQFDPAIHSDTIQIDELRIQQVVRNLLENAFAAAPDAGRVVVDIETLAAPGTLKIEVSDNGCGVPHELREKIFTPFFTTKTRGTGLGLAISKRVAGAHGGSLSLTTSAMGGACFCLEIPQPVRIQKSDALSPRESV